MLVDEDNRSAHTNEPHTAHAYMALAMLHSGALLSAKHAGRGSVCTPCDIVMSVFHPSSEYVKRRLTHSSQ